MWTGTRELQDIVLAEIMQMLISPCVKAICALHEPNQTIIPESAERVIMGWILHRGAGFHWRHLMPGYTGAEGAPATKELLAWVKELLRTGRSNLRTILLTGILPENGVLPNTSLLTLFNLNALVSSTFPKLSPAGYTQYPHAYLPTGPSHLHQPK
ncbi:hypothetical protein CROQUDRAFT_100901 [Cronartium quercuum f. sp. fusiforme G11]|uniref:Uncharacterized protein n=1 Tax=Cronartium quercuum f. sp. fusiforme G11 TaxID=708437 RepID=A0A9P6N6C0_9BASI|nr:hypothetical protein CROQUDRAFT_100901 [Cronartium quercuum f. sp. fusiforme G11]